MKLRRFFNMQIEKMNKVSRIGSLVMLGLSLAISVYTQIEPNFPDKYLGFIPRIFIIVPLLFIVIFFVVWGCAHIYNRKLEMNRTEARANIMLNPFAVYAIGPFEEMWYRNVYLVMMKNNLMLMECILLLLKQNERLEKEIEETKKQIAKVENWLNLGYIPKKEFPPHLLPYHISNIEERV